MSSWRSVEVEEGENFWTKALQEGVLIPVIAATVSGGIGLIGLIIRKKRKDKKL
jgi:hypothetical protein